MNPLTPAERQQVACILLGLSDTPEAQQMKQYIQHGRITTYAHCLRVAQLAFWLNRRLHLHCNERSLVRGAFLHDFYLYDWHCCKDLPRPDSFFELHGFSHPRIACENAEKYFALNQVERDIIITHMWPLTLRSIPATREAALVCLADKICSTEETVMER